MRKNLTKPIYKILLAIILAGFGTAYAQEAASYNDYVAANENSELVSLATEEPHSSIYLDDGVIRQYGDEAPKVLFSTVSSIPMLYEANEAFSEVELIRVNITSASDETAKINLDRLAAFKNLKYVLFVYEYDACGDNGDSCLKAKTEAKVASAAESAVQVLYLLFITN